MATSSLMGGAERREPITGKDTGALGPSDNSDSGSDAQGAYGDDEMSSDTDAVGTGERATIGPGQEHPGQDILPDHIERGPGEEAEDGDDEVDVESLTDDDTDDLDDLEDLDLGEDDPSASRS